MNLFTRVNFGLLAIGSKTVTITGGPPKVQTDPISVAEQLQWSDGAGTDKANQSYEAVGSLAALEVLSLDLTSGLVDAFGLAVSLARVKALFVKNTGATTLVLGGTVAIVPTGMVLLPGEIVLKATGHTTAHAVANGSTDALTISNSSSDTAGSYRLIVIGQTT